MEVEKLVLMVVFTSIVIALLWARIYFFKVNSHVSKLVSYVNDPAVLIQMAGFYYYLFVLEEFHLDWRIAILIYLSGLILFVWALVTARQLDFASSNREGKLISNGPYAFVRHPCYVSYILFWLGSCLLLSELLMWVSFVILIWVYAYSARSEESQILQSHLREDYLVYKSRVGMFLPKLF